MTKNKVNLDLTRLDGNVFVLMGAFSDQAKKDGWGQSEIDDTLKEAMNSDYDNLVRTLSKHCKRSESVKMALVKAIRSRTKS